MLHNISFFYRGNHRTAHILISLQNDLKVVFVALSDAELIERFGEDVDFQTDMDNVIQTNIINEELMELQTSILESVKLHPDFIGQKSNLHSRNESSPS